MKRTLIIGLGRLGEALKNRLITTGVETVTFSSRSSFSKLREDPTLNIDRFDYIIWVARDAGIPSNPSNSSIFYYELLGWIDTSGWCGNFVFTSSAGEIYGETTNLGAQETDTLSPASLYGTLKAKHESMISALAHKNAFSLLIIRVSNVYQLDVKDPGIVGAVLRSILDGEILVLHGGHQTRDFISLDDLVTAVIKLCNLHSTGVFNIATGHSISIDNLICVLESYSSKKVISRKISGFNGVIHSQISNSKLVQALSWTPKPFEVHLKQSGLF